MCDENILNTIRQNIFTGSLGGYPSDTAKICFEQIGDLINKEGSTVPC